MKISKKIILIIFFSIVFITITNFLWLYISYNIYIKNYINLKNEQKNSITIDYINKIIEEDNLNDIEDIFNDIEIELFEIIDKNNWIIPLNDEKNIDIVIKYLSKSWVNPKYIEEIIPKNYFEEIIKNIKNTTSPEYDFIQKIIKSIIIINIISISILIIIWFIFTIKTIRPIKEITLKLDSIDNLWNFKELSYKNKDEIWLLVWAINKLNNKIKIQNKIRDNLLADISHELKTPITSLQCYMEWIKDNIIKLDERNLNNIIQEMNRLIKLVNIIMEFEKFNSEKIELKLEKENVKYITENIIKQFKQRLKTTNQKIITSWIKKEILTHKDSYIQIAQNIIWNFIKYAWENTILKIDFQNNYIIFSDNWVWIDEKYLPFIKEKFFQIKKEKTWNIDKRWIWVGFSIIEKLILAMNWKMEIKSKLWEWLEIKIITKNSH